MAASATAGHKTMAADAWPHTSRLLPWLLACFLVMLWLVPFDAVDLPVSLPFDTKLDRLFLLVIGALWLAHRLACPKPNAARANVLNVAIGLFVAIAVASVIVNIETLAVLNEVNLAVKKLVLLGTYVFFFVVVSTSVRSSELRPFCTLLIGLACITAVGVVWEYRTGTNLFYEWFDALMPGGVTVGAPPGDPVFGRPNNTGPTGHALAVATMLAITFPFAVVRLMNDRSARNQVIYGTATALILAGNMATIRKTGAIVPVTCLLVLLAFRPRAMFRILPVGLVIVLFVNGIAPGAMVSIKAQLLPSRFNDSGSTLARKDDYRAVKPDERQKIALGRGYGSYDPHAYRFLDNQVLMLRLETGILGVLAYTFMIAAAVAAAYPAIRSRDPSRAPPALAAAAGAVGFGVATFLFDLLAFPHVPYIFFFLAAIGIVASRGVAPVRAGMSARVSGVRPEVVPG